MLFLRVLLPVLLLQIILIATTKALKRTSQLYVSSFYDERGDNNPNGHYQSATQSTSSSKSIISNDGSQYLETIQYSGWVGWSVDQTFGLRNSSMQWSSAYLAPLVGTKKGSIVQGKGWTRYECLSLLVPTKDNSVACAYVQKNTGLNCPDQPPDGGPYGCGIVEFTDLPITVMHDFKLKRSYERIDALLPSPSNSAGADKKYLCRAWDMVQHDWKEENALVSGKDDVEMFYSGLDATWLKGMQANNTNWVKNSCPEKKDQDCDFKVTTKYWMPHEMKMVTEGKASVTLTDGSGNRSTHARATFSTQPTDSVWYFWSKQAYISRTNVQMNEFSVASDDEIFAPLC